MQFWNELEGQTIDGLYPLRRLVRSEGRSAWFETETGGPQGTPATISLTEALTDADEVTARLQAAQELKHPNLVSIVKVGQVSIDNTVVVYAVMEHIEQSLSDVLQGQALSLDEGREVAEALVGALTAVHQQGMSHGHVEAASVLATEETVKLRSDCLQTTAAGQAEDVAGIGTTLFHAFTQRKALTATDAQINRIPAPFAEIIRNSFAKRWSLAQIANALKPAPPVTHPVPPVPAAIPAPTAAPIPPPAPVRPPAPARPPATASFPPSTAAPARLAPEPAPVQEPPKPPAPAYRSTPRPDELVKPLPLAMEEDNESIGPALPWKPPFALYAGLAIVVLAILAWMFLRPHPVAAPTASGSSPQSASQAAPPTPQASPEATVPAAPPAVKPSAGRTAARQPKPAAATPTTPAESSNGRTIWRVVAYTYVHQQPAEDMVAKINGKHSDLQASVFSPANKSGVYLVVVGGAMDHNQAMKMRDKARSEGLPPDSYAQNFSE